MTQPSEPLLQRLRELIDQRGLNTASLAQSAGLDRTRVRKVLAGREPMTVDELIQLTQVLELSPDDLGMSVEPEPPDHDPDAGVQSLPRLDPTLRDVLDPYANHVQQLFEVGFGLGCDFFFRAETDQLQDSGVPAAVLDRYKGNILPIKLDAAYHHYNDPRYTALGLHLKLSFEDVYDCFFPWAAVQQVLFLPAPPAPEPEPEPESEDPPSGGSRPPFLRLVE